MGACFASNAHPVSTESQEAAVMSTTAIMFFAKQHTGALVSGRFAHQTAAWA